MSAYLLFIFFPRLDIPTGLGLFYVVHQLQSDSGKSVWLPVRVIGPSKDPLPDHAQQSQEADTHKPGGFETTTPARDRLQNHALESSTTVIGSLFIILIKQYLFLHSCCCRTLSFNYHLV